MHLKIFKTCFRIKKNDKKTEFITSKKTLTNSINELNVHFKSSGCEFQNRQKNTELCHFIHPSAFFIHNLTKQPDANSSGVGGSRPHPNGLAG
jgi:hypothetical protein